MTDEPDYWGEKTARLLMTLEDWHGIYDSPAEVLKAEPDDLALLAEALRLAYVEGRLDALEEADGISTTPRPAPPSPSAMPHALPPLNPMSEAPSSGRFLVMLRNGSLRAVEVGESGVYQPLDNEGEPCRPIEHRYCFGWWPTPEMRRHFCDRCGTAQIPTGRSTCVCELPEPEGAAR